MRPKLQLFAIPIAMVLVACSTDNARSPPVIYQVVSAEPVFEQDAYEINRYFSGVLAPARSADIAFELAGTIESVLVDEGDRLKEGEILAKLDTALLGVERRQLQAELSEAEASLRLAKSNLERHASLELDGFASKQRRDELEASRDAIQARIWRLKAGLDGNRIRQKKSRLLAPFDGVVGERYQEDGSSALPGKPVIKILEAGNMEARIGVPSSLVPSLSVGDSVSIAMDGQALEGSVLAVGAELKAHSHTASVRVLLPQTRNLAGSLVKLQLLDSIDDKGFAIPQRALTATMRGLWRVYVVKPVDEDLFRVEARDLQLRYLGEEESYVQGGLSDGEWIVTDGVQKVVPGQLVKLTGVGGPV